MATVTFLGPFPERRSPCNRVNDFIRGAPREVSQAWIDENRLRLPNSHWCIEGDEPVTQDEGGDGVPDSGWRRKDIIKWLGIYNAQPKGYATKTQLLDIVDALLNPDRVEEVEDLTEAPVEEEEEPDVESNLEEGEPFGQDEGE